MTHNNTTVIQIWICTPVANSQGTKAGDRRATMLNGWRSPAHRGEWKEAICRLTDDVEGWRLAGTLTTANNAADNTNNDGQRLRTMIDDVTNN